MRDPGLLRVKGLKLVLGFESRIRALKGLGYRAQGAGFRVPGFKSLLEHWL